MNLPTYTIAIATRNRIDALRLSIPAMLKQTCRPTQIIVADSSDDHASIAHLVDEITTGSGIPTTIIRCEKGLTKQRNRALEEVSQDIVFFPDDDSIWFERTAEHQLYAYAKDTKEKLSAVCAANSTTPPEGFLGTKSKPYTMTTGDRLKLKIARYRYKIEDSFFIDPAKTLGRSFYPNLEVEPWMVENDVVPVEWMTGFRMSFRTSAIRAVGFATEFSDYSLFEDIDASFGVWKLGGVVGARKSKVFHYRSPEQRGNGFRLGLEQILNKAYIVAKHSPDDHPCRSQMIRFAKYKCLQYRLSAKDQFSKDRYDGAKLGAKLCKELIECSATNASGTYRRIVDSIKSN